MQNKQGTTTYKENIDYIYIISVYVKNHKQKYQARQTQQNIVKMWPVEFISGMKGFGI